MEHFEIWVTIAGVWIAQLKVMVDLNEIKSVIRIKKAASFRKS